MNDYDPRDDAHDQTEERKYSIEEIGEAEEKALGQCLRLHAPKCRSCRLRTYNNCISVRVSTCLRYGSLKKPERDEKLIGALERVQRHLNDLSAVALELDPTRPDASIYDARKIVNYELKKAKGE